MGEQKMVQVRILNPHMIQKTLNLTGEVLDEIIFPPNGNRVYSVPFERVAAIKAAGFQVQVL